MGTHLSVDSDGRVEVSRSDGGDYPLVLSGGFLRAASAIYLEDARGARTELPPPAPDGSVEISWPGADPEPPLMLHIRGDEHAWPGGPLPAITLRNPDSARDDSPELRWEAPPIHALFDVTLLRSPDNEFVDRTVTISPAWQIPWSRLDPRGSYRVIVRGHDGRKAVEPLVQMIVEPQGRRVEYRKVRARTAVPGPVQELREALTSGERDAPVPESILTVSTDADDPELAGELCRLLYDVFDRPAGIHKRGQAINFGALEDLAARALADDRVSRHVQEILSYLSLYGVIDRYFHSHGFWDRAYVEGFYSNYELFTAEHAEHLLPELRASPAYRAGSFSTSMVEGIVLSAFDRSAAARGFAQARVASPDLWDQLWVDTGASTYLSGEEVQASAASIDEQRAQLSDSLSILTPMPSWRDGDWMFMCSCDRFYFRVYFPLWLAVAEYLKARQASFHFLLNGPGEEVAEAVALADDLRRQMGLLRGFEADRYADNISFSSVAVPGNVPEVRTFYACSRFLLARRIAREYEGPLVICDTDAFFREDPRRWLEGIEVDKIGLAPRRGLHALKAWRRFVANALFLPFSERAHTLWRSVEDYVLAGLTLDRTWMLDQNALAYLYERGLAGGEQDLFSDVDRGARRPMVAHTIKGLLQDEQRRGERWSGSGG